MTDRPEISLDRIRGMFMGAFLGDALGTPHELHRNAGIKYTGILEHVTVSVTRFQGKREIAIGQISDDSEMTLALIRRLIQDRGYVKENVIKAYMEWANSGCWMMGTNTRKLLQGVKTIKGYQGRLQKILEVPVDERSQSNGAMMRCSPLAILWDNQCVVDDVNITNPNNVCIDCNLIYVTALRAGLLGMDGPSIFKLIKPLAQTDEVKFILEQVENRETRDISEKKGWCLHALWCSMMVITSFTNYSEAMEWIIGSHPGSDTDTNACIAGSLLGSILGLENMVAETTTAKNIDILLALDTTTGVAPRPEKYGLRDFYQLTEAAHALTK
jgi:ADP-ribosyl-[dinitrogen reductase] hydrolase